MIPELTPVQLLTSLSQHHLDAGAKGTVVYVYRDGEAYEVEFFSPAGDTIAVVTCNASQIAVRDAIAVA